MTHMSTGSLPDAPGEVRKSLLFLTPTAGSNLIALVTLPIFLLFLTPEDYGYLALATAYASVVVGFSQFGLAIGFEREFFSQSEEDFQVRLLTTILAIVSLLLILIGIPTWAFRSWISSVLLQNSALGGLVFVTFLSYSAQALRHYQLAFFRNRGEAALFARYSLVESISYGGLGLYFVVVLDLGVVGLPLAQVLGCTFISVLMFFQILYVAKPGWEAAGLRRALRIGIPLTPAVLVKLAGSQFDKVLLGFLESVAGAGIYSIGQRLAYIVFSYTTALENVSSPQVLKQMFKGGVNVAGRIGSYLTPFAYWSVFMALAMAIFAREGLTIFAPEEYGLAAPLISILSFNYAVAFFGKQKQLIFAKKTHLLPVFSMLLLILNVGFNIPLISAFGAIGAALGTATAGVVYTYIAFVISQRHYPIHYEFGPIIAIFGHLFLATAASLALNAGPLGFFQVLGIKITIFGGFIWLGWKLEILTNDTLGLLRRALFKGSRPLGPPPPSSTGRS
jgi:O-antigen/teichoic acid export membrane protein